MPTSGDQLSQALYLTTLVHSQFSNEAALVDPNKPSSMAKIKPPQKIKGPKCKAQKSPFLRMKRLLFYADPHKKSLLKSFTTSF